MLRGVYSVSSEHERLEELMTFVENLDNEATLLANTVSNPIPICGYLPRDKAKILHDLRLMRDNITEQELRAYRRSIRSL